MRGESGEIGLVLSHGERGGLKYMEREGEGNSVRTVRSVLTKMHTGGNELKLAGSEAGC